MHNQLYNNDSGKAKNLKWGGMHKCLPLLRNKVSFLALYECWPPKLQLGSSWTMSQPKPTSKCNARRKEWKMKLRQGVSIRHCRSSFMTLPPTPLLKQLSEIHWLDGLRLSAFEQDGHGDLRGLDRRNVIHYVHRKIRVVLLCVLFNSQVALT
jgi:hypothetical protein